MLNACQDAASSYVAEIKYLPLRARRVVQWLCLTYLAAIFINTPEQHPVEARRLASCGRHYLLALPPSAPGRDLLRTHFLALAA
jgi:hypothetical protein